MYLLSLRYSVLVLILGAFFFAVGSVSLAQAPEAEVSGGEEALEEEKTPLELQLEAIPSPLVACSDYFTDGSVEVNPSVVLEYAAPGVDLGVTYSVRNNNAHPIVDGAIYVKLFKKHTDEKTTRGPDTIDQFYAVEGISLAAGEERDIQSVLKIPERIESGDYQIATYFVSARRFNLQGLSFTNDIVGAAAEFTVESDMEGSVHFDTESVTVNGEEYDFVSWLPYIDARDDGDTSLSIPIEATIRNTKAVPQRGKLTWKLYSVDGLREEALLHETTEEVELFANESVIVRYDVSVKSHPIYYVVGELVVGGAKSIIDVRFSSDEAEMVRFHDVGVSSYPLTSASVAYACVHDLLTVPATEEDLRTPGKVELTVTADGEVLGTRTYEGVIPFTIGALSLPFENLAGSYSTFDVTAKLFLGGEAVDEVTMHYACDALGADCTSNKVGTSFFRTYKWFILGGGALILMLLAYMFARMRKPKVSNDYAEPTL